MIHSLFTGLKDTVSVKAVYQLLFAYVFGSTLWGSFIAGFIAYRALPKQQFGLLQSRIFPIFFSTSTAVTATLFAIWATVHSDVREDSFNFQKPAVTQAWVLMFAVLSHATNLFYFGPETSRIMFQRHKLERSEKKQYNDPTASPEMKQLNKQFGALHGISSLVNLLSFLCLVVHGVWIGNRSVAL
ncbi:hypothetical protein BDV93DRAFT_517756 [Ceratobasidium sp. AG-I]|nr:hypothetical protein BDV93DRAFT_517756 [Ceratobasidium sp. AG-I]